MVLTPSQDGRMQVMALASSRETPSNLGFLPAFHPTFLELTQLIRLSLRTGSAGLTAKELEMCARTRRAAIITRSFMLFCLLVLVLVLVLVLNFWRRKKNENENFLLNRSELYMRSFNGILLENYLSKKGFLTKFAPVKMACLCGWIDRLIITIYIERERLAVDEEVQEREIQEREIRER